VHSAEDARAQIHPQSTKPEAGRQQRRENGSPERASAGDLLSLQPMMKELKARMPGGCVIVTTVTNTQGTLTAAAFPGADIRGNATNSITIRGTAVAINGALVSLVAVYFFVRSHGVREL